MASSDTEDPSDPRAFTNHESYVCHTTYLSLQVFKVQRWKPEWSGYKFKIHGHIEPFYLGIFCTHLYTLLVIHNIGISIMLVFSMLVSMSCTNIAS